MFSVVRFLYKFLRNQLKTFFRAFKIARHLKQITRNDFLSVFSFCFRFFTFFTDRKNS